jgi:hypothetical protein
MRTTAFRLTLLSAALFALSSFVILSLVYTTTAGAGDAPGRRGINEELARIEARYEAGGPQAANRYILQRSVGGGEFLYLLVDDEGRARLRQYLRPAGASPDERGLGRLHL